MKPLLVSTLALPLLTRTASVDPRSTIACKNSPDSSFWPAASEWQKLNASIAGKLVKPEAPFSVCHPNLPTYNNVSCSILQSQWINSTWHARNPFTADYNDFTCQSDPSHPCTNSGYPAYVINATCSSDVAAGVNFARSHNIRLIVKGTGHDFSSRSSGSGSLSVYTHNLRGLDVKFNDPRAIRYGGSASVRIAAGMQWRDIYTEAAKWNLTIVGGADNDVGIGGWILGGGHSPISAKYGLGADQVLEMDVVTADGKIRTIDENRNPDLFWAMRGGGGSSFAVMLSVTVKAYPKMKGVMYLYAYNTTANSEQFFHNMALFHQQIPQLSNAGAMGYYWCMSLMEGFEPARSGQIFGIWYFPETTVVQVKSIIAPLEAKLNQTSPGTDSTSVEGFATEFDDFSAMQSQNEPQTVGSQGRLGSRLLDEEGLTKNVQELAEQFKQTIYVPWNRTIFLGHVVAGPGVRNAVIPGGSNAVLPAWRKAYTHAVVVRVWEASNQAQKLDATTNLREIAIPSLEKISPSSGAYINEADPTDPNWQKNFFGDNYPRLLKIKKRWDPAGLFWCKPCVGHELWKVIDGPEVEAESEWGIGQVGGRICRDSNH